MPANGEKQPEWLMICKCGATVKSAGSAAAIAPLFSREGIQFA
jgi:hypothetical protein